MTPSSYHISGRRYGGGLTRPCILVALVIPETDDLTKVVSQTLGKLLHALQEKKPKQWDLALAQAEFAYNNMVNRSTRKTSFELMEGLQNMHYT